MLSRSRHSLTAACVLVEPGGCLLTGAFEGRASGGHADVLSLAFAVSPAEGADAENPVGRDDRGCAAGQIA